MADSVQIKRGKKTSIPTLQGGEPGYCTDTKELYIGTSSGNVLIAKASLIDDVTNLTNDVTEIENQMPSKLTATAAAMQNPLVDTADLPTVITAFNTLIANMKASGLMK